MGRKLETREERQASKLKEEHQISLTQMQQIRDLKEKIKLHRVRKCENRVKQLEAKEGFQVFGAKEAWEAREEHMQQVQDLKKKIKLLQQSDEEHSRNLWEANKLRERAIQDKENNCAAALQEAEDRVHQFEDRIRQLEAREEHQASETKKEHQSSLAQMQ